MNEFKKFLEECESFVIEFQYHDEAIIFCDICKKKIECEITINLFNIDEDGKVYLSQTLCKKCRDIHFKDISMIDLALAGHDVQKMIRDREWCIP